MFLKILKVQIDRLYQQNLLNPKFQKMLMNHCLRLYLKYLLILKMRKIRLYQNLLKIHLMLKTQMYLLILKMR